MIPPVQEEFPACRQRDHSLVSFSFIFPKLTETMRKIDQPEVLQNFNLKIIFISIENFGPI